MVGLQATPPTNPKVMIKVFVSQNPNQEPVASVFTFTSARAREDCDMIQESIKLATAERNRPKTVADILKEGEEGLLKDTELQQSLLRQDSDLSKIFKDLVIPKLITVDQFWRARVVFQHP
jgi:TFIIH p62 subunit, N-terminal domain/BSD domain